MNKLRFGVIGCGGIAQMMHLPTLTDYEEFEVIALSDLSAPTLNAVGEQYHIDANARYTDYHDLLARQDIDAVGIFHGGSHHDTVIDALKAGKHIFVEKPLAWNTREVEEIAALAAQSDRTVQVGYHKLYDPGFAYARERVREMQEKHDLAYARITMLHPDDRLGRSTHRVRRGDGVILEGHSDVEVNIDQMLAEAAGGALASLVDEALGARKADPRLRLAYALLPDSIIHHVYVLYGFLGKPEGVLHTDMWRDGLSIHSVIAYPNDLRVTLDWHFLAHLKDYKEEYAFFGHRDRVYFQLPSPYLTNFPSPVIVQGGDGELAWEKRVIVSYDEAFRRELLAFYDNVTEHKTPISSVADALEHARFMQEMIDKAE